MSYLCYNGEFLPDNEPVLLADNRCYRYGDGLFETMRVDQNEILLGDFHFERLFSSISLLKMDIPDGFTSQTLRAKVSELCQLNDCEQSARVRLSVSRGNARLTSLVLKTEYIIECIPLAVKEQPWDDKGLTIGIYQDARKSCDSFSNLKSANRLPYVMASIYAGENQFDDCLLLNVNGAIADSTIANIFIIKDGVVSTPSLDQGCVAGVMRKYLVESLQGTRHKVQEGVVTISNLENADEVFLTNAVRGIQWVRQFRDRTYQNDTTREIFETCINTLRSVNK